MSSRFKIIFCLWIVVPAVSMAVMTFPATKPVSLLCFRANSHHLRMIAVLITLIRINQFFRMRIQSCYFPLYP